jgi:Copper chaperone
MFLNKVLNFGYLSVISIVFGITMSTSLAKAGSSLQSNSDYTVLEINEEFSTHQKHEQAEENVGLSAEELDGLDEYEVSIKGMTCANCEAKVKGALLNCSDVKTVWVSHIEGNAVLEADVDMVDGNDIIAAIEKAGFSFVEEE